MGSSWLDGSEFLGKVHDFCQSRWLEMFVLQLGFSFSEELTKSVYYGILQYMRWILRIYRIGAALSGLGK